MYNEVSYINIISGESSAVPDSHPGHLLCPAAHEACCGNTPRHGYLCCLSSVWTFFVQYVCSTKCYSHLCSALFCIVMHCALSCTVLHCLAPLRTVLHRYELCKCTILQCSHSYAQTCTILRCLAPPCTVLHCALSCTVLHSYALTCTTLHYPAQLRTLSCT